MATEQTLREINEKIRPAADTLARMLTRAKTLAAYLAANATIDDIPNTSDMIAGTDTDGRKGVRGDDIHRIVGLLGTLGAAMTDADNAAVLRVAVNPGTGD